MLKILHKVASYLHHRPVHVALIATIVGGLVHEGGSLVDWAFLILAIAVEVPE